ncbi:MAG: hypothetical protein RBT63_11350, partial [Bdellovibrionales bacterium]|nr:hypothetical protein [Bdellovibrionales bacterium]
MISSELMELIWLYRWTLLSSLFAAPALSLIGAQCVARGWATRTLVVSQASSTGLLVALVALAT